MSTTSSNTTTFEQHPHFPSGVWEGFYIYGFGLDRSKHQMHFNLDFRNGIIQGSGGDDIGPFRWTGTYDAELGKVEMTKHYLGRHTVEYDGRADDNGIYGSWTVSGMRGGFHIWPQGRGISDKNEEEKTEINDVVIEEVREISL